MSFRLDVKNISYSVGALNKLTILDTVSLSFNSGELVGIIGPSGSGKSTLLKAICGFQRATRGQVLVNGIDIYKNFEKFKRQVGYVPQDDIIHKDLSVYKTLKYSAMLRLPRETKKEVVENIITRILKTLELEERKKTVVKKLSGGQRKRVSIGVELLTSPRIMFMDEPTSGLDPALEEKFTGTLRNLADENRLIFVTTHVMKSLFMLDLLVVMVKGKLAFAGKPQQALDYFGVEDLSGVFYKLGLSPPQEWQKRFLNSPCFSEYIAKRMGQPYPSNTLPEAAGTETGKIIKPMAKSITATKTPDELLKELEKLKKQLD